MLLETFTTLSLEELKASALPDFLDITQEVTGDPAFSMYNLVLKSEWTAKDFCRRLVKEDEEGGDSAEDDEEEDEAVVMEAQQRFVTRFDNTSDYSSGNEM